MPREKSTLEDKTGKIHRNCRILCILPVLSSNVLFSLGTLEDKTGKIHRNCRILYNQNIELFEDFKQPNRKENVRIELFL